MCSRKAILMFFIPFMPLISSANSTAASMSMFSNVGIFFRKFMPLITMSSIHPCNAKGVASVGVCLRGYSFQMIWIHTFYIFTQMIYLIAFWYRSLRENVAYSMGAHIPAVNFYCSITSFIMSSNPIPATRSFFYFIPKSFHLGVLAYG